ncbi:ClpP class serine protease [Litorimonas taeanensis]|uniref:ClpP class serine protease n=1 Tax=Litorimonas taeanensis TaxID=568099 RepID=A0A420WD68_9PROT|nr:S49 family peptidase [Litorimonas taeanensis]RKQ68951.1 ClpP class serine protease [Litorimonas taeanensis]
MTYKTETLAQLPRLSDYLGQPLLLAPLGQTQFVDQLGGAMQPALGSLISQLMAGVSALMPMMGSRGPTYRYLNHAEINGGEGARPLWDNLSEGIATIRISGPLYDRAIMIEDQNEQSVARDGYDRIAAAHAQAQLDPNVQGIIFELDTPGGLVKGGFEAVDYILQAKAQGAKPVWGIVTGAACSAGYSLAACCDRIIASSTAVTGSIGVMLLLSDNTGFNEKIGIRPVPIHFGDFKGDGGSYKAFDEDERARLYDVIAPVGEVFVAHVARARGLDTADVLAQNANIYTGHAAQTAGLVDIVANPRRARALFSSFLQGGPSVAVTPAQSAPAARATPTQTATTKETDMSFKAALEKLLEASNSTLNLNQKSALSLAMKTAAENEDEESKAEGDDSKAEGDEKDPKAESDDEASKAENEDEDTIAEGEDEDTKAEGDDQNPKTVDEDEDATARALTIMKAGQAAGCSDFAEALVNNKKLTSVEALDLIKTAPKAASAQLQTMISDAPKPLNSAQPSEGGPSADSKDPVQRMAAAKAANPKLRIGRRG